MRGKVYLVGAGPGDPGLITEKALKLIGSADVIVYDRLISKEILRHAKSDAELIYVGKSSGYHLKEQSEINSLLVARAREGRMVVRLKGGDPFIFGRGGEEAEALAEAGIPFEVIPGVTSAVAAPAYAGIPLTHRDLASSVAIVTGHEAPEKAEGRVDWGRLAGADTIVVLMGMENLPAIAAELIKAGRSPATPTAVIRLGTLGRQQTVTGTLNDIAAKVKEAGLAPPAIIVIGEVVKLREKLSWFEKKPLFGKRVLVPRATHQAGKLSRLLSEFGAEPVEIPTISIEPLYKNLDPLLDSLPNFNWLVFTSPNGVETFFSWLLSRGRDARILHNVKIFVLGPGTEEVLRRYGLMADAVPERFTTEEVAKALWGKLHPGERVLLARTDIVDESLVESLSHYGAEVFQVAVYATRPAGVRLGEVEDIDVVTFTSASTVRGLYGGLGGWEPLEGAVVACIGPVAAQECSRLGLKVDIVAREHTIPGLVHSLVEYFQTRKR